METDQVEPFSFRKEGRPFDPLEDTTAAVVAAVVQLYKSTQSKYQWTGLGDPRFLQVLSQQLAAKEVSEFVQMDLQEHLTMGLVQL